MVQIKQLDENIEVLRERLYKLAQKKNYRFLDEEVMHMSEKLDALIVERERCTIVKK